MSNATTGPGFLLQKGDGGAPENFTTVAEVGDIKGPILKTDVVDVTNQSSPGSFEEKVPTILRSGDVTFPINYDPTNATHDDVTGLGADLRNKTLRNFRLQLKRGAHYIAFAAYVTGLELDSPVTGVLKDNVTLSVTGLPLMV